MSVLSTIKKILFKRGSSAARPVLDDGEIYLNSDTKAIDVKFGDTLKSIGNESLQTVTDRGSITTNNMKIRTSSGNDVIALERAQHGAGGDNLYLGMITLNDLLYQTKGILSPSSISFYSSTGITELRFNPLGTTILYLPHQSAFGSSSTSVLATNVNGVFADATGRINLPSTVGSLQDVTNNGNVTNQLVSMAYLNISAVPEYLNNDEALDNGMLEGDVYRLPFLNPGQFYPLAIVGPRRSILDENDIPIYDEMDNSITEN